MLKDITLGQYFPGKTFVHRLDPRTKLILVVVYIVALFLARSYAGYALVFVFLAVTAAVARIKPKALLSGMKPLIIIIVFTGLLNIFYTTGDDAPLVEWWIFRIYKEGIVNAVFMILRIMLLISGTFLLTYTTSPIALTDGLEALMRPLKKIKVPVHELAMMMCIALRFIPTLIEETDKIISAQKARGADFETGNIFRRADELAVAMECRCYHGGEGRTKLKVLQYGKDDLVAFAAGLLLLAGVIVLRSFDL